jgi:hypothetical protein
VGRRADGNSIEKEERCGIILRKRGIGRKY